MVIGNAAYYMFGERVDINIEALKLLLIQANCLIMVFYTYKAEKVIEMKVLEMSCENVVMTAVMHYVKKVLIEVCVVFVEQDLNTNEVLILLYVKAKHLNGVSNLF